MNINAAGEGLPLNGAAGPFDLSSQCFTCGRPRKRLACDRSASGGFVLFRLASHRNPPIDNEDKALSSILDRWRFLADREKTQRGDAEGS